MNFFVSRSLLADSHGARHDLTDDHCYSLEYLIVGCLLIGYSEIRA